MAQPCEDASRRPQPQGWPHATAAA